MRLIRLLKNDLAKESQSWVSKDIISQSQAEQICALYGADYHGRDRYSYGYLILMVLGYLFLGLAVITLLSHNWDEIPRGLRMVGLIGATVAAQWACFKNLKQDHDKAAVGYGFLACLLYGASIMLIAQIYHLGEHYPDGVFWWAMGSLPFALLLRSHLLHLLTFALAVTWFFVESNLDFYPTLFPLFLAALGWHLYKERPSTVLMLLAALGFGLWVEYTLAWVLGGRYRYDPEMENLAIGVGLAVLYKGIASAWCESQEPKWQEYGTSIKLWTMRLTLISLFVLGFEEPWRGLLREQWYHPTLAIGIAVGCSLLALFFSRVTRAQFIATAVSAAVYVGTLVLLIGVNDRQYAEVFQVLANIAAVGWGIWLIIRGINDRITQYFYTGLTALLGTALLRYIDLVGDYVGAAVLFGFFALVLLVVARRWYKTVQVQEEQGHA